MNFILQAVTRHFFSFAVRRTSLTLVELCWYTMDGTKLNFSDKAFQLDYNFVFYIYFDHFLLNYDVGVHETLITIQFMC